MASLRERVARFDLDYFYDTAITSTKDRADYETDDALKNLEDSRLISGCLKCGILPDVAYQSLDHNKKLLDNLL